MTLKDIQSQLGTDNTAFPAADAAEHKAEEKPQRMGIDELRNIVAANEAKKQTPSCEPEVSKISLKGIQIQLRNEAELLKIKKALRENGNTISDREMIGEVLDHVLWRADILINNIVGEFSTPFLSVEVESRFAGPFSESASLIDSMTVAAWYSREFKGEVMSGSSVIESCELRFARSFWKMFCAMAKKDEWFGLFNCISVGALTEYLNSVSGGRGVPCITWGDGDPILDYITVGFVFDTMNRSFGGWDPGEENIETYRRIVLRACGTVVSLINAIVEGIYGIDERMAFYKENSNDIDELLEEERNAHNEFMPMPQTI